MSRPDSERTAMFHGLLHAGNFPKFAGRPFSVFFSGQMFLQSIAQQQR